MGETQLADLHQPVEMTENLICGAPHPFGFFFTSLTCPVGTLTTVDSLPFATFADFGGSICSTKSNASGSGSSEGDGCWGVFGLTGWSAGFLGLASLATAGAGFAVGFGGVSTILTARVLAAGAGLADAERIEGAPLLLVSGMGSVF